MVDQPVCNTNDVLFIVICGSISGSRGTFGRRNPPIGRQTGSRGGGAETKREVSDEGREAGACSAATYLAKLPGQRLCFHWQAQLEPYLFLICRLHAVCCGGRKLPSLPRKKLGGRTCVVGLCRPYVVSGAAQEGNVIVSAAQAALWSANTAKVAYSQSPSRPRRLPGGFYFPPSSFPHILQSGSGDDRSATAVNQVFVLRNLNPNPLVSSNPPPARAVSTDHSSPIVAELFQALLSRLHAAATNASAVTSAAGRQKRLQDRSRNGEASGKPADDDPSFRSDSPFPWGAAAVAVACGTIYYQVSNVVAVGMFVPVVNGCFMVCLAAFAFHKLRDKGAFEGGRGKPGRRRKYGRQQRRPVATGGGTSRKGGAWRRRRRSQGARGGSGGGNESTYLFG